MPHRVTADVHIDAGVDMVADADFARGFVCVGHRTHLPVLGLASGLAGPGSVGVPATVGVPAVIGRRAPPTASTAPAAHGFSRHRHTPPCSQNARTCEETVATRIDNTGRQVAGR
ncbi:hypothetical protein GCM10009624_00400 [Gordonia sinesedis]